MIAMEGSPLFCFACGDYLDLRETVVAYAWLSQNGNGPRPPRFVHPACRATAGPMDPALSELGERTVRDVVMDHIRDSKAVTGDRT